MARIHGVDNRPKTGVLENPKTFVCPLQRSFIPPLDMIYQDHNFVLWQVLFFNAWEVSSVCGFEVTKSQSSISNSWKHHTYMSLYCTTRAQYQTVSTSMFTLKQVVLSSNFVRTMFSNKSLILLNSMMSLGWHSSQNLSNSMKR